jgi:glycosyltransferase involved in cell wall biosynthesis
MTEVLHPALRNYRLKLFESLHSRYNARFIFTIQAESKEFGGIQIPDFWNFKVINVMNSPTNWFRLASVLLKDDYKVLLTSPSESFWDILALIVSKLRRKKIIFWGESWYWPSHTVSRRVFYYMLLKWVLNQGNAIIAMGQKQYTFYKTLCDKNKKIFCAPKYVVPYQKRDSSELLQKLATLDKRIENKKIVLYMSQVIERKGLDYLIKAFKILENKVDYAYLLIAGNGPFEDFCRKLTIELNIKNVMFVGYIPDSDIELYHNLANILVLPSVFYKDYPEPDGYILYESMSVGKPLVITNACGAAPEFVRNGVNGFVVKNRNEAELAHALLTILQDDELEREMSINSKKIFDEKISSQKQFDVFSEAIDWVIKEN